MSSSPLTLPLRDVEACASKPLIRLRAADGALTGFSAGAPIRVRVELPAVAQGWRHYTVRDYVLEQGTARVGAPEALLIDDTGFPKQGKPSVGVARQYCGQLSMRDNFQAAVSVSLPTEAYSLPVAYRPSLPQSWAADATRRRQGKVPEAVQFATEQALALQLLERPHE